MTDAVLYTTSGASPRWYAPTTRCTRSSSAADRNGSSGAGPTSCHSSEAGTPGVNPVVTDSGSTISSAAVAVWQSRISLIARSVLAVIVPVLSGAEDGAT